MYSKLIGVLILSVLIVACEEQPIGLSTNEVRPAPAFTTEELSNNEQAALNSLCTSFQNMRISFGATHEFSYKRDNCSDSQESYSANLMIDVGSNLPVYTNAGNSVFFFPEIRFDLETNHSLSAFCNRLNGGNNTNIIRFMPDNVSNGIRNTLEVIPSRDLSGGVNPDFRNTVGCYDSTMLAANTNALFVCVRLWTDQISGSITQKLSYESLTFVVSNTLVAHSGFTVHREKHNYVQCTDKKKSLVYKATRVK